MIPKKIHYCWFGGRPLTEEVKTYIETWKLNLPDYEIKQWDETNFDVDSYLYTRQAYFAKRFAFVSDVARLVALVNEGGIYLDTDIIIKRPFPVEWLNLNGFGSFEHDKYVQTGVMACCQGHPIFQEFLKLYDDLSFFKKTSYDITTNVARFTAILEAAGFKMNNELQTIDEFTVFPQKYLCANDWRTGKYDDDSTFAIHDFKGAWGRDALRSALKFQLEMLKTIVKWNISKLY